MEALQTVLLFATLAILAIIAIQYRQLSKSLDTLARFLLRIHKDGSQQAYQGESPVEQTTREPAPELSTVDQELLEKIENPETLKEIEPKPLKPVAENLKNETSLALNSAEPTPVPEIPETIPQDYDQEGTHSPLVQEIIDQEEEDCPFDSCTSWKVDQPEPVPPRKKKTKKEPTTGVQKEKSKRVMTQAQKDALAQGRQTRKDNIAKRAA